MPQPLIIIIGAYGSGKSEYALNLVKSLKKDSSNKITIADLDVVNPYFRSRDVQDVLEKEGIELIASDSVFKHADLPMISPRVKGSINDPTKAVILDVGGDIAGCKALGRFIDDINQRGYKMCFVVNTKRPFTSNVDEIILMIDTLEQTSKLKITDIICNTNLMEDTNIELIKEGIEIISEVAEKVSCNFDTYLVMNDFDNIYPDDINGIKKVNLQYFLSKPWEK